MSYEDADYNDEPARVECVIIHRTDKAILIRQGTKEYWIPRSMCRTSILGRNKLDPRHFDATIEMAEWLAEEKGINYK